MSRHIVFVYIYIYLKHNAPLEPISKDNKINLLFFILMFLYSWTACERLIILEADSTELRDYGVLLYHCGFYKESLQYLKLYQDTEVHNTTS